MSFAGKKHKPETIEKMKAAQKKIGCPWFKGKKQTPEHIAKRIMLGEKNPMWKGGITPILVKIRGSIEYKLWRTSVFTRDNYTCVWCGDRNYKGRGKTIILQADHIKSFSQFPALRFAIDNGRTLCFDCHKKTDNYGRPIKKNG